MVGSCRHPQQLTLEESIVDVELSELLLVKDNDENEENGCHLDYRTEHVVLINPYC